MTVVTSISYKTDEYEGCKNFMAGNATETTGDRTWPQNPKHAEKQLSQSFSAYVSNWWSQWRHKPSKHAPNLSHWAQYACIRLMDQTLPQGPTLYPQSSMYTHIAHMYYTFVSHITLLVGEKIVPRNVIK